MTPTEQISVAFLAARREGRALPDYPGEVPPTLADAYAVQARSVSDWGEPVVGFKVGGIPEKWREQYPSPWLAGPVFESALVHMESDGPLEVGVFEGGFAAYEPELVMRLGGLGAARPHIDSLDVAKAFVRRVHIGAEIASSPLKALNALGPGSIVSDFGNQVAVVVGSEIDRGWLDRLDELEVATEIDGAEVGRACVKADENGPLGAVRFVLNHLRNSRHGPLPDDIWVSTGAITGVHESKPGTRCTMSYGGLGTVSVSMVARRGQQA